MARGSSRQSGAAPRRNSATGPPKLDINEVRALLIKKEGCILKAWLRYFDHDVDLRITPLHFGSAMRELDFDGDTQGTFAALDPDRHGEVALEALDEDAAALWRTFREWCADAFSGARDFLDRMTSAPADDEAIENNTATLIQFLECLRRHRWDSGGEERLYEAISNPENGTVGLPQLRWLDIQRRRKKKKEAARQKALMDCRRKSLARSDLAKETLARFKVFLKRQYGSMLRAWRQALSPHDLMVVQKLPFYKACADLGFSGDTKLIWLGLMKDEVGGLSIDEFDAHSAVLLANFQAIVARLGGTQAAFRVLDKAKLRKVKETDFCSGLQALGFSLSARQLFFGLDRGGQKYIVEEDLLFLDRWKPPAFLTVAPSGHARDEVKKLLIQRYGYYLKAWRRCLDLDGSNRCTWAEFQNACKKIGYDGNIAGAWRMLDENLSGSISMKQIDSATNDTLKAFCKWAQEEFGSVRSAFTAWDEDGSRSLTKLEFKRSLRIFGFKGDLNPLFYALDCENNGLLDMAEVAFLDDWTFPLDDAEERPAADVPAVHRPRASQAEDAAPPVVRRASGIAAVGSLTPRVVVERGRTWWNEVPPARSPSPVSARPSTGDRPGSSWCSFCKTRGKCRHQLQALEGCTRPASRSCWKPSPALALFKAPAAFPVTVRGDPRAERRRKAYSRRLRAEARARPLLAPSAVPSRAASRASEWCWDDVPSGLDVQVLALAQYPLGTVDAGEPPLRRPAGRAARAPGWSGQLACTPGFLAAPDEHLSTEVADGFL